MNTSPASQAKQRVLDWVRAKNPKTMELKFGCKISYTEGGHTKVFTFIKKTKFSYYIFGYSGNKTNQIIKRDRRICEERYVILGSDMGLQELMIALHTISVLNNGIVFAEILDDGRGSLWNDSNKMLASFHYDLTKNLHEQSPEFYESLLPLIS